MGDYVVEQRIEKDGIFIRVAGGKELFVKTEDIKAELDKGTKEGAVFALQNQFVAAFGDVYDPTLHEYTIDDKTGAVLTAGMKEAQPIEVKP
jgi:hypothetical protein